MSSVEVTDEQLNKWAKSVEDAGKSAEAMGWVVFASAGIIPWLLTNKIPTARAGSWFGVLILGWFFIATGKYIRNTTGSKVKLLLYLNGFVSLLLFRGIIPLIVCVQSFIGASKYSKIENVTDIKFSDNFPISTREKVFFTVILIAIIVSLIFAFQAPLSV